jgi:hypothetical protein
MAAARGDTQARAEVEAELPRLEELKWHISEAVQRIWQGERDWHALAEGLDNQDALLLLRVLETLTAPPGTPPYQEEAQTTAQLLASLPAAIREAIEQGDEAAFQQAFEALAPGEQEQVASVLEMLHGHQEAVGEEQTSSDESSFVSQFEPLLRAIAAVAQGDTAERDEIEEVLTDLEEKGWHLKAAVQRLWAGERDAEILTEGLDEQDTLLIARVVEILVGQSDAGSDRDL